jgi:hypothetical protein
MIDLLQELEIWICKSFSDYHCRLLAPPVQDFAIQQEQNLFVQEIYRSRMLKQKVGDSLRQCG